MTACIAIQLTIDTNNGPETTDQRMGIPVRIRPREQRLARRVAKLRNNSYEEIEGYDNQSDSWGKDPLTRNYIGVLGGMAFAIQYDLQIDAEEYSTGDAGVDFEVVWDGEEVTIDVKATRHDPEYLEVKKRELRADYYVLVQLHSDEHAELHGYASAKRVRDAPVVESFHYDHENYRIQAKYLDPLPETLEPVPDQEKPSPWEKFRFGTR